MHRKLRCNIPAVDDDGFRLGVAKGNAARLATPLAPRLALPAPCSACAAIAPPTATATRHAVGRGRARLAALAALGFSARRPAGPISAPADVGGRSIVDRVFSGCFQQPAASSVSRTRRTETGKNSGKMLLLQEKFQNRRKTCLMYCSFQIREPTLTSDRTAVVGIPSTVP